jgi:bacillithiol system protein YtxJ
MRSVTTADEFDTLLQEPLAVVVKHSAMCAISHWAMLELRRFQQDFPDCPMHIVDVLGSRPVSAYIAQRMSIRHESPQVLVLRAGKVVWSGSHEMITARALSRCVAAGAVAGSA